MFRPAVLIALALFVASCTPGTDDATTSIAATSSTTTLPQATTTTSPPDGFGGEATVGFPFGLETLNPFHSGGMEAGRLVGNALWATVYDIDPDTWERIPDNVDALPSTIDGAIESNADGSMTVQYQIPRTATWSDGRPISGADLAFTAEAMRDLAFAGNGTVHPIMRTVVSTDSVEQVAWITFSEANLSFEDALWIILPSHALEGVDLQNGTDGSDWPSGGPFMVDSFVSGGDISLVRNPNYWKTDASGRQLPYLDRLVFTSTGGEDGAAFVARTVDAALVSSDPETLTLIAGTTNAGAELLKAATPVLEHLTFNFGEAREVANPSSMNDERTFRQAVPRSLDPDTFARPETTWSGSWPGVLTPTDGSAWGAYAYDTAAALDAVIALDNLAPVSVLTTTGNGSLRIDIASAMRPSFEAMGVRLETTFIDSLEFFGDVLGIGTYDLGMWAWVNDGGYGSVIRLMEALDPASDAGGFNGWGVGSSASEASARYSELVVAARTTADTAEFAAIVSEAEAILASELPLIPLFNRASHAAVWADRISNVAHNGSSSDLTWNVEVWRRVGE
jgi:peptide/nickel transport system substrate-binding protein